MLGEIQRRYKNVYKHTGNTLWSIIYKITYSQSRADILVITITVERCSQYINILQLKSHVSFHMSDVTEILSIIQ